MLIAILIMLPFSIIIFDITILYFSIKGSLICLSLIFAYVICRACIRDQQSPFVKSLFKPLFSALKDHIGAELVYECCCSHYCNCGSSDKKTYIHHQQKEQKIPKEILLYHPHGIFSLGMLATLNEKNILSLGIHFMVPIWREIGILLGFSSVSKKDILSVEHPVMSLGGGRESLMVGSGSNDSGNSNSSGNGGNISNGNGNISKNKISNGSNNTVKLIIKKRKGIFKLAKEKGFPIKPVIGFGELDLYEVWRPEWYSVIESYLLDCFHFTIPIFWGFYGSWIPKRAGCGRASGSRKVLVVVGGREIWVKGTVDEGIEEYCKEIQRLYYKYRLDQKELEII